MTLEGLAPAAARALAERDGHVLLDVRAPADFARGHPPGALSVPFSERGLAPRVRAVVFWGSPVVLVASDAASAEAAAAQLGDAGVDVKGVLAGGFASWRAAGLPEATVREVPVDDLPRLAPDVTVVDVREPLEWTTGHVPGALLVPLGRLREALPSLPRSRGIVAICEAGIRSCTAASLFAAAGFTDVAHVPAGSSGYRRAGHPLAFPTVEEVEAR